MTAVNAEVLKQTDLTEEYRILDQLFPQNVDELVGILGVKLVAVIGNVAETRAVRQWTTGDRSPSEGRKTIIAFALRVANLISRRYNNHTAQSWFLGLNSHLGDKVPALVLRDVDDKRLDEIQSVEAAVIQAVQTLTER